MLRAPGPAGPSDAFTVHPFGYTNPVTLAGNVASSLTLGPGSYVFLASLRLLGGPPRRTRKGSGPSEAIRAQKKRAQGRCFSPEPFSFVLYFSTFRLSTYFSTFNFPTSELPRVRIFRKLGENFRAAEPRVPSHEPRAP